MGTEGVFMVNVSGHSITTTVTTDPDVVNLWIDGVKSLRNVVGRHVGFEVEFLSGTCFICTVQLCLGRLCLLYQIHRAVGLGWPASLAEFLCNRDYIFIGTYVLPKLRQLERQVGLTGPGMRYFDLVDNVVGLAREKQGLMVSNALGLVDSGWGLQDSILSTAQIHHATMDAFFNLDISWRRFGFNV